MKNIFKSFIAFILCYLSIAFVYLEINFTKWDNDARVFIIIFTLICYMGFTNQNLKQHENTNSL